MLEIMKTIWIKGEGIHILSIFSFSKCIWFGGNPCTEMMLRGASASRAAPAGSEDNGGQRWRDPAGQVFHPFQIGSVPWGVSHSSLGSVLHNIMLQGLFIYLPQWIENRIARVTFSPHCFQNGKKFLGEAD